MSEEEKKALDKWMGDLIQEKFKELQNNGIEKDLKSGKQNISWKDIATVIGVILGMLTVVYFSANANTKSECTAIELSSHKQVNEEQFKNIQKDVGEIKKDISDIRTALYRDKK